VAAATEARLHRHLRTAGGAAGVPAGADRTDFSRGQSFRRHRGAVPGAGRRLVAQHGIEQAMNMMNCVEPNADPISLWEMVPEGRVRVRSNCERATIPNPHPYPSPGGRGVHPGGFVSPTRFVAIAATCIFACVSLAGCSGKQPVQQSSTTPHNVTLTGAQQNSIHIVTVASTRYHTTITTTGVVDFDHDHATDILA